MGYSMMMDSNWRAERIATSSMLSISGPDEKKENILERLRSVIGDTLDRIVSEEESKGVSITQTDLVDLADRLDREGKHEFALEVFEWMDRKNMTFSPSELRLCVDIICRTKGSLAALAYLRKVDPGFNKSDVHANNWPAYSVITQRIMDVNYRCMLRPLVRTYDGE